MCLGVPGQITTIDGSTFPSTGMVDFDGVQRPVCLAYTPDAQIGDFVIVHVGFAISRVDEEEAARTFAVLKAIPDALAAELGP